MTNIRLLGSLAVCVLIAAAGANAQTAKNAQPAGYLVSRSIPLPNGGGWDYLSFDPANRHLFVTAGDEVEVLNPDSLKLITTITGQHGTHGVAIADVTGRGFISNGGSNSITLFDLKTLRVLKSIPLNIVRPDGIIYDPSSDRIFAFNHDSHAVALDARTGEVLGAIPLPSRSAEFAVADGRGHVFDNLESSSSEIEIDAHSLKISHDWPLTPCESPSGNAIDASTHRLFIACDNNQMVVVNSDNGKLVATIPIGPGADATRFDPKTKLAFASSGGNGGSITVVREESPSKFVKLGEIKTEPGARTMEFDPKTGTLFTVTAKRNGRAVVPGTFHLIVISKP